MCARARGFCVCARRLCVCARAPPCLRGTEFACEELDMSLRGIRHLKREEVKATRRRIKHQRKHLPRAVAKADENISSELAAREPFFFFSFPNYCFALPFGYNHWWWWWRAIQRVGASQSWRRWRGVGERERGRETHLVLEVDVTPPPALYWN